MNLFALFLYHHQVAAKQKKARKSLYHEVEKILDHKDVDGELFYLIRFKFYSKDFDQWVSIGDIKQPTRLLHDYYTFKIGEAIAATSKSTDAKASSSTSGCDDQCRSNWL